MIDNYLLFSYTTKTFGGKYEVYTTGTVYILHLFQIIEMRVHLVHFPSINDYLIFSQKAYSFFKKKSI